MSERIFKRKIYSKLKEWKENSNGKSALLLEGARRIGKSTVVEEFGQKEYRSYILIDFNEASKGVKDLFDDYLWPSNHHITCLRIALKIPMHLYSSQH